MTIIDLAKKKEPINGRLVQYLLKELVIDGGKTMSYVYLKKQIPMI